MDCIDRITVTTGLGLLLLAPAALAQPDEGPVPVKYTEARQGEVRSTVELTGTVEARRTSVVASEVEGKVVSLEARQGDRVEQGAVLARLRRENLRLRLEAVAASHEESKARLSLAETNLRRTRELHEEEVVSRQLLDDAISEHEAAKARVEQLQAEVARLRDDLGRSVIRAPFTGVVVAEHTEEGEWISAGGPVVELVDTRELEVTVEIPERHFGGLAEGRAVKVRLQALGDVVVEGEIRAVVPRADPQARTFPVKIRIPNEEGRIGAGMLARVRIPVGEPESGVLVPKDALVDQGGSWIVYEIGPDDTVRPVPVRTGGAEGAWIAVEGSVAPGARIVTRGNERLRPGAEVVAEPREDPEP